MKKAKETVGERIKKKTEASGLTLHQVAVRAGVNPSSLYTITSRGGNRTDWDTLQRIAAVLDVSPEYLKYGDILLSPEHRDAFYSNLSHLLSDGFQSIENTCTLSSDSIDDWKMRCRRHENGEQLDLTYGKAERIASMIGLPLNALIEPKWYRSFVLSTVTNDSQIIAAETDLTKVVSEICNYDVTDRTKNNKETYIERLNYLTNFLKRNASMFTVPVIKKS